MRMKAESRLKLLRDQLLLSPDLIEHLLGSSEKSTDSTENRCTEEAAEDGRGLAYPMTVFHPWSGATEMRISSYLHDHVATSGLRSKNHQMPSQIPRAFHFSTHEKNMFRRPA